MCGGRNFKACLIIVFLLAMACTAATGRTIYVDDDGPADFNTIQAAIDDSNDGDAVNVAEGTYFENINFGGKNIILRSIDPTNPSVVANTVIDGRGAWASVVTFAGTESASCMLSGFTITNGWDFNGGGIFGNGTLATIQYNIISGNQAGAGCWYCGGSGGGLYDCDGTIQCNVISRNQVSTNEAGAEGGGLYGCDGTIKNNIIVYNRVIGLGWVGGGGLADCHGTIWNNTIFGNSAHQGGGLSNCNSSIRNCIIWGNSGGQIYDSGADVTYSDIEGGYSDTGNIDADPCFVEIGYWDDNGTPFDPLDDFYLKGDYHLRSEAGRWTSASSVEPDANEGRWTKDEVTSPCIDAGNPNSAIGLEPFPNGGVINMGAYGGTTQASKSYFGQPPCEIIVAGDINGDCEVNWFDFRLMALHWLRDENQ